MSNDPVGALDHLSTPNGIHGFNRYVYGNNNPYRYTDPTGKSSVDSMLNVQYRQLESGQLTVGDLKNDLQDFSSHENLTKLSDVTGTGAAGLSAKVPLAAAALQVVSTTAKLVDTLVNSNEKGTTLAKEVVSEVVASGVEGKVKGFSFLGGASKDVAATVGALAGDEASKQTGDLVKIDEEFGEK